MLEIGTIQSVIRQPAVHNGASRCQQCHWVALAAAHKRTWRAPCRWRRGRDDWDKQFALAFFEQSIAKYHGQNRKIRSEQQASE